MTTQVPTYGDLGLATGEKGALICATSLELKISDGNYGDYEIGCC